MPRIRRRGRWPHRFGTFVSKLSVPHFATRLERKLGYSISTKTIYEWMSGRRPPELQTARAIIRIARGRLGLEDICRPSDNYRTRQRKASTPVAPTNPPAPATP